MKIEIKKIIGGFFLMAFVATNLVLSNVSKENASSFSLKNVVALQASAGEASCDASDKSVCTIIIDDLTATGTGKVVGSGLPGDGN